MKFVECRFEAEALAAALESRWPDQTEAELRSHVASCETCLEVVAVAAGIQGDRLGARASAQLPDAGLVWWRAQLRARREAAEAAGRPITATQWLTLACLTGFLGACFGATSTWFQAAMAAAWSTVARLNLAAVLPSSSGFIREHALLTALIAAMLLLVPSAVLVAISKD